MKKKTKILIVTSEFPPEPGGIGNHAYNLAKQLQLNDFDVEVVADQRITDSDKEREFDAKQFFLIKRVKIQKVRFLMYLNRVTQVFKSISRNDTIIASGKFSLWVVTLTTYFFDKNFVAVIHGSEVNFRRRVLRKSIDFSLKKFHKIVAVSKYTKSLIDYLNLKNIEVIPNGFELIGDESKHIEKLSKGDPNLITVGSVTDRKGQKNVIKMLPNLIKRYPRLHYHVVGSPVERDKFIELAKKINVDKHITFYGMLDDARKNLLLKGSDIFVMLSDNTEDGDIEGFGIALIEANSLGIPTVGANNCGIEDAIDNHKSGVLIDNKNPIEFENAIIEILGNYTNFQKDSKLWASKFTWDIIINKYIKALKS